MSKHSTKQPAKQTNKQSKQKTPKKQAEMTNAAWIPMRTGVIIVAITSIGMAVLTALQAIPSKGLVDGILLGLMFGGFIWIIFLGFYLFNRWIR